jgi:predicted membrane protein
MKRSSFFWGAVVVLLGVVLLMNNLHLVAFNVWTFFWPVLLVLLGLWFLLGPTWQKKNLDTIQTTIPLQDTTSASVEFHHGAGRLEINASARPGELVNGWFTGGVTSEIHRDGAFTSLQLHTPSDMAFEGPWPTGSHGYEWVVGLSPEIPLKLVFKTGASESIFDLSQLKVTNLTLETGASSTEITLPANAGMTSAQIKSGVASVKIHVPAGVGARIHVKSGLSGINVDTTRFIREGEDYVSTDYASTVNKLDLDVETGVGSVDIN